MPLPKERDALILWLRARYEPEPGGYEAWADDILAGECEIFELTDEDRRLIQAALDKAAAKPE
jgi:hypothetical protein